MSEEVREILERVSELLVSNGKLLEKDDYVLSGQILILLRKES